MFASDYILVHVLLYLNTWMLFVFFDFVGGDQLSLSESVEKKEAKLWQMVWLTYSVVYKNFKIFCGDKQHFFYIYLSNLVVVEYACTSVEYLLNHVLT